MINVCLVNCCNVFGNEAIAEFNFIKNGLNLCRNFLSFIIIFKISTRTCALLQIALRHE